MKLYYTPNDFSEGSDSERIQAAISHAAGSCNQVRITSYNEKSDSFRWVIDKTILIPSDMTIILDNCHIIMADDAICQMFANSNVYSELGNTLEGEQKNINIIGVGNAVLDGGNFNELTERTSGKNGLPLISNNLMIYFHNVSNFRLENFSVRNQRYWAIEMIFSRFGKISGIDFGFDVKDTNDWHNQDGIDLRIGCNNILIENISGETGDDCIALTALTRRNSPVLKEIVDGKDTSIHDIIIQNIRCYCNLCAVIRILSQHHHKIYNILMNNIMDSSEPQKTAKSQMMLRIGDSRYFENPGDASRIGDISDIAVNNVFSKAMSAIHLDGEIKNFNAKNIYVQGEGIHAITIGGLEPTSKVKMFEPSDSQIQKNTVFKSKENGTVAVMENISFENVYYSSTFQTKNYQHSICKCVNSNIKNITIKNIVCDSDIKAIECENCIGEGVKII